MTQSISMRQWWSNKSSKPLELIVGLLIFAIAAGGGAIAHIASISFGALFLISLFYFRSWPLLWRQISAGERLVLFGFFLYFFSAIISYYNVSDYHDYFKILDRYGRFFLVIPIYLLLSKAELKIFPYLLAGIIVAGPLYLGTALVSLEVNPHMNAKGAYHHITFGDISMLSALFLITVLTVMKTSKMMKMMLAVSIICLLYASVLSQARGAWIALPFSLMLLLAIGRIGKVQVRAIIFTFFVLVAVVIMSPMKDIMSSRVQAAVNDIELFQSGENYATSVGHRLAMWHVAINVWKEHPVIGTGPGDYDIEFEDSQAKGLYVNNVVFESTHNIFIQALATTGTFGFVILCLALFILPFRLFWKINQEALNVASVAGMVGLIAFAVFGLTESWIYRAPVVSFYLLFIVTLATTAVKGSIEQHEVVMKIKTHYP